MKKLHAERSSEALAEEWNAIFAELEKPEFQEAARTLPYLGAEGAAPLSVPPRGEEWEGEAEARKFFLSSKGVREQLRTLASKSRAVYFPMEMVGEKFFDNQFHLPIRTAIKLLVLDGHMALRYNAMPVVIDDIRALFGMATLLQGEPNLMALLIDKSAESAAIELIQQGVARRAFDAVQLKELLSMLQSLKVPLDHYRLAIEGERVSLVDSLEELGKRQGFLRHLLGSPQGRTIALDILDTLQAVKFEDLDKSLAEIDSSDNEAMRYQSGIMMVTSADHIAPFKVIGVKAAAASLVEQQMQIRLAQVAVAAQIYLTQEKRLPASLSDLASVGIEPDKLMPLGGKPFGYRLSEDKATAELWGFDILNRAKQTPDEPPVIEEPGSPSQRWLWKL